MYCTRPTTAPASSARNTSCPLFDLEKDPNELRNVAGDPAYAGVLADLRAAPEDDARHARPLPPERICGTRSKLGPHKAYIDGRLR
jgi:hypothetical protein